MLKAHINLLVQTKKDISAAQLGMGDIVIPLVLNAIFYFIQTFLSRPYVGEEKSLRLFLIVGISGVNLKCI